ncbi:hypothetical protein CDAR_366711 [Caerostris darwini]|uniref:Uncharacterized protein n=1 Tax=Caerostris darwini TaxID=1538125 RepID=A0AAV4Q710_9ARAC|nr:hypothetical protein CDAR_366711 [Caerostris darwini]
MSGVPPEYGHEEPSIRNSTWQAMQKERERDHWGEWGGAMPAGNTPPTLFMHCKRSLSPLGPTHSYGVRNQTDFCELSSSGDCQRLGVIQFGVFLLLYTLLRADIATLSEDITLKNSHHQTIQACHCLRITTIWGRASKWPVLMEGTCHSHFRVSGIPCQRVDGKVREGGPKDFSVCLPRQTLNHVAA